MNYVGIDISKYKHDIFILSDLGEVLNEGFSFANNAEGFGQLQAELERCGDSHNIRIGLEATGNYGINLKLFLEKIGFHYMEINPLLIKEHIQSNTLRRTKTDKLDAKAIADYIISKDYRPHPAAFYNKFALKQLTRLRSTLVTGRSRYLVQITNVLDCTFPEFKPFFGNKFSVTALYILVNYPSPESVSKMNTRSFDTLRRISRGRFSMDKFVKLKALAKNTVGVFNEYYRIELETLIDLYCQIDAKIDEVESEITEIINALNPPTLSIKGIGAISAAVIISEFGDISRFDNPNKMLSFAGLEPGYFQSGTSEYRGHMVKRGSPQLRCALMNCSRAIRLHNEVFTAYYLKKTAEGKPHYVALNHVAKKLVRLIFALETKGEMFSVDKSR
jgi:Transposase and inactivated derivatives